MSWHRCQVLQCDDDCNGDKDNVTKNLPLRCVCSSGTEVRKSALKKSKQLFNRCENKNDLAFGNCKKKKKVCTFKPQDIPEAPSCSKHHNVFRRSDKRKNKEKTTDFQCSHDARVTKKRTRFTEATRSRSPCSILSLQSKYGQGNPYIQYYASNGACEGNQTIDYCSARSIADDCKTKGNVARCTPHKSCRCCNVSNETTIPDCQPHNKSCNGDPCKTVCTDVSPCTLRAYKTFHKRMENKKTGEFACNVSNETTITDCQPHIKSCIRDPSKTVCTGVSPCTLRVHKILHKRMENKKTGEFACNVSNETTITDCQPHINSCIRDPCKTVCTGVSPCTLRVHKILHKRMQNKKTGEFACNCVDVTTTTNSNPEFLKVIKPTVCINSKGRTKVCADPWKYYAVEEATSTQDISKCSKMMKVRMDECQNSKWCPKFDKTCPSIFFEDDIEETRNCGYQSTECNKIMIDRTCSDPCEPCVNVAAGSDPCEPYVNVAAGTDDKLLGCSKILRPKLRECKKPKWYENFRKKTYIDCKYLRDVSTTTDCKARFWMSRIIIPRVRECRYSRWNRCVGKKTRPNTCYWDNCNRYKCLISKWKQIFRKKTCACECNLDVDVDGDGCEKAYCQRFGITDNPCSLDYCDGALLSSTGCGINEKGNNYAGPCQSNICENRDLPCYMEPCQSNENNSLPCYINRLPNKCENRIIQCYMGSCQPNKCEKRYLPCSSQFNQGDDKTTACCSRCDVSCTTSLSMLYAFFQQSKKCKPVNRPQCKILRCIKCSLSTCFKHVLITTAAVCCGPCIIIAVSYWLFCYLLSPCEQTGESCQTQKKDRGLRLLIEKCSRIKGSCRNRKTLCTKEEPSCYVTRTECGLVPFDEKETSIRCLPKSCFKNNIMMCTEEINVCNNKKTIRICRRSRKRSRSCPNPNRKYNLYYVKKRGWVIKPAPRECSGGGDNNLSTEVVPCDRPNPNTCLQQEIFCNANLNNCQTPCDCSCQKTGTRASRPCYCARANCICQSECKCQAPTFSNEKDCSAQKGFFNQFGFFCKAVPPCQNGPSLCQQKSNKEQSGWRRILGMSKTETEGATDERSNIETSKKMCPEDIIDNKCQLLQTELFAPLQPSTARTYREFSKGAGSFCKFLWITCLCCPFVFCVYCCQKLCIDMFS